MNHFLLEDFFEGIKRGILWILVNMYLFTRELNNKALRQYNSGTVLIHGLITGLYLVRGYQSIGMIFPQRKAIVRYDHILAFVKMTLALITIAILSYYLVYE
jgi:hypothetical protein